MTLEAGDRADTSIAFAKIFPPIGIARVGDSETEFFIGPEFDSGSNQPSRFRDKAGLIKRQAARFRIYGFNAAGKMVKEITAADAEIVWSVHLANKKAAWFEFNGAAAAHRQFAAEKGEEKRSPRRNYDVGAIIKDAKTGRFVSDTDRQTLEIDGGSRTISGANVAGSDTRYQFKGTFKHSDAGGGHEVYLGELKTDADGRLIVLGGRGVSLPVGPDGPIEGNDRLQYWIVNYANNDDWCDDTSDGPVMASVVMASGEKIEVQGGAWVLVAPPDFAPDVTNVVTLYDVMEEVAVAARMKPAAGSPSLRTLDEVSFQKDILPLLNRLNGYRWVSPLGLRGHGLSKPGDTGGSMAGLLRRKDDVGLRERERFVTLMRKPTYPALDPETGKPAIIDDALALQQATSFFMPPLSGDEGDRVPGRPNNWLSLTRLQYRRMEIWGKGSETDDGTPPPRAAEPAMLTWNALTACAGGAFFPGIEITSIARDPSLYSEPFRIDHARVGPGDVTKFMACPWQADFYECRDAWWPAQRPDTVITDLTLDELLASFTSETKGIEAIMFQRERWDRGLERKPRPSRDYLTGILLPEPETKDASEYAAAVADTATDVLFGLARPSSYLRLAMQPASAAAAAVLPSPWRLQYLIQEQLDGYSGRYFLPTVPRPDDVLKPADVPAKFHPPGSPPSIKSIRHDWTALRVDHPAYAGYLLGSYAAAARAAIKDYLTVVVAQTPAPRDGSSVAPPVTPARSLQFNLLNASDDPSSEPNEFMADSDEFRRLRGGEFMTQLVSGLFLSSSDQSPDMAMVDMWRSLGFVRNRRIELGKDVAPLVVQVESERPKFDGKSFRDYFYYLMNISEFPDFEAYAKSIVYDTLDSAQILIDQTSIFDPNHPESFVPYTPTNFRAKLEQIYEVLRAQARKKPSYNYNNTREQRIQALTGNAPFNQVDGAWLRFAADAGTMDEISALLFAVWSDEVGNGDPSLHHGNLYTTLLRSLGVYLPDVSSRAYVDDSRFDEATFVGPVFELAISLHSQEFFPELLGMTLFLEWEVLSLVPGSKRLEYFGIDSQFFRMHIGIDNATEGHGAKARRAIELYLDRVIREGGPDAQQLHWKRVWRGFVAFATAGYDLFTNVGPTIADGMTVEGERGNHMVTPADKVSDLIQRKLPYGNLNHLRAQLGPYRINDLFDDPRVFMTELANSPLIVPGDPDNSRFLNYLTTFQGPMYKVFSANDILLWTAWIEWLGQDGDTLRPKAHINRAESMRLLLAELRSLMIASDGHRLYRVPTLVDPVDHRPLQLLEVFATKTPEEIMKVLSDPGNGWIVKYRPMDSALIVDLLRPANAMGKALDRRFPKLFNQIGRMVVYEWIAAGCPLPDQPPPDPGKAVVTRRPEPRLFVQQYGMGAVH